MTNASLPNQQGVARVTPVDVDRFTRDWSYAGPGPLRNRAARLRALLRRSSFPRHAILRAGTARRRWTCYFMFLPEGRLAVSHRYTLERLRRLDAGLMLIVATPDAHTIPAELMDVADAVIWKALDGFDFSAYALGLSEVARSSPGADTLVMNDSVFGPFTDLDPLLDAPSWDLQGFTAYAGVEDHVQSYAFHLRGVTADRNRNLRRIISTRFAHNRYKDVIYGQETMLTRVASRSMSVGALWHAGTDPGDPTVCGAVSLVENGFPFLKRKLLGWDKGHYPEHVLHQLLEDRHHPLP